jgi:phage-related protein
MATLSEIMVKITADKGDFERVITGVMKSAERLGATVTTVGRKISRDMNNSISNVSKSAKNLPEHLKPFNQSLRELQKEFKELEKTSVQSLDKMADAAIKTRVGFDKLTSVSKTGKQAIKVIQEIEQAAKETQLAVLGLNKDGTVKISTQEAVKRLKQFESEIIKAKGELEKLRDAGDIGSYTAGMDVLNRKLQEVRNAMQAANQGGMAYISTLQRLGIITESVGNAMAVHMEQMRQALINANNAFQARSTFADKATKFTFEGNLGPIQKQALALSNHLEKAARQGTALNIALKELGNNASMKDTIDYIRYLNMGMARYQQTVLATGIAFAGMTYGLIQLSNVIDGRLVKSFERFKETWKEALEPFVRAWTHVANAIVNAGTAVGKFFESLAMSSPIVSQMIGWFIYLSTLGALVFAPLAFGAKTFANNLKLALGNTYPLIKALVDGLALVLPRVMMVAGAIVLLGGFIAKLWKESEGFRNAVVTAWNMIKTAVVTALEPIFNYLGYLKAYINTLISTMMGGASSTAERWQMLGNAIGKVILFIASQVVPILSVAMKTIATIIVAAIKQAITVVQFLNNAWENHRGTITAVFSAVKTVVVTALTAVFGFIKSIMPTISSIVKEAFSLIKQAAMTVFPYIAAIVKTTLPVIAAIFKTVFPIVVSIVKSAWANIKAIIVSGLNIIKNAIRLFSNVLKGNWKGAWENVKAIVKNAVTLIWNYIQLMFIGRILKAVGTFGRGVLSSMKSAWNAVYNAVRGTLSKMASSVKSIFSSIKTAASIVFNSVKSAITRPIEAAKDKVLGVIGKIKSAFAGLKITIPKPKLPHISVSKVKGPLGIELPRFSVKWYATGGIFTGPSIIGVGEKGDEAVVPLSDKSRMKPFALAVADFINDASEKTSKNSPNTVVNINISQLVVREEADVKRIAQELERLSRIETRAKGGWVYA